MKNQYFGDINDYRKYGLLRVLSGDGKISSGVCWMLTPSDGRTDGQFLRYLDQRDRWRGYDSDLFEHLYRCVRVDNQRDVRWVEDSDVLPNARFFSRMLSDDARARRDYFSGMLESFRDIDLIFFDPDNGFEVPSKPMGRRGSSKYLYWGEMYNAYRSGHSVLIYQHFVRENRESFIQRIAARICAETNAALIYSFRTSNVVFFLASQAQHADHFTRQSERIPGIWGQQILVSSYLAPIDLYLDAVTS
jgi:hypothetical protein